MTDRFLPYEEAKAFVHTLKLKGWKEWKAYYKEGKRPRNIPSNPHIIYKNAGWKNLYDWLGTAPVEILSYEEAKAFVHTLKLKNIKEWWAYSKSGKRPPNIPGNPYDFYRNKGWINWYDYTGDSLERSIKKPKSKSKHLKKLTTLRNKFVKASNALDKIKIGDANWLSKTGLLMDIITPFMMDIYKLFPCGDDRKDSVQQFLKIQDDLDILIYHQHETMFCPSSRDVLFKIAVLIGKCLGIIETRIEVEEEIESYDYDNIPF